jgi:shikimate dehydrogenase
MGEGDVLPLDPAGLHPGQLVVDLIYHPAVTPLLTEAAARGARTLNGLGMLVHQAAVAFEHWTGRAAPVEVMRAAATGSQEAG